MTAASPHHRNIRPARIPLMPLTRMRTPVTTGGLRRLRCPTTAGGCSYTGIATGSRTAPEACGNMNGKPCEEGGPRRLPLAHTRMPVTTGGLCAWRCPSTAGGSRNTGHGEWKPVTTGGLRVKEWEALKARRPTATATHTHKEAGHVRRPS